MVESTILSWDGISDVNEEETIKVVKAFFKNDFQRIRRMAKAQGSDLRSPSFEYSGKGDGYTNATVDKMDARIHAQLMWDAIKNSVETMDRPHKDVLTLRIYQGLSWTSIQERLPYGETRAREILYEAMLWFADAFSHHKELRVFN